MTFAPEPWGDSAFALPKLLRLLELEGFRYAIRIKANAVLERKIAPLLKRPVGRPSCKPKVFYHSFRYQAKSWECARRVVAKVEWHAGELFLRVGFLVTNLKWRTLAGTSTIRKAIIKGSSSYLPSRTPRSRRRPGPPRQS